MQEFDELGGEAGGIEALFVDSAGENTVKKNADVMVKRERYSVLSASSAAIALHALQQFAPAGGAGHRTSMRGGGPLTTLVLPPPQGNGAPSFWHVVWMNVCESEDGRIERKVLPKVCPWLAKTYTSESGPKVHQADGRVHPHQAFFGMPRRIRLRFRENTDRHPCDLTSHIGKSIVTHYVTRPYGVNYGQWRHHLTPYYRKNACDAESFATHPPAGSFGYRNWLALVLGDEGGIRDRAAAIEKAYQQRLRAAKSSERNPRLLIAGWAMSNMKPLDFVLAEQPLHLAADAAAQRKLDNLARKMVLAAEKASTLLIGALQAALKAGGNKPKGDSARLTAAREAFFVDSETDFHEILQSAVEKAEDSDSWQAPFAEQWLTKLQRTAFSVFDDTVAPDPSDPLKARQVVEARRNFTKSLLYATGNTSLRSILMLPVPAQPKRKAEGAAA